MANETIFSPGLKAGTILATTGTTLGKDVANVGFTSMTQMSRVTQASGATSIVLPAGSMIVSCRLNVTTAWTGAATTCGVGTTVLATAMTAAGAIAGGTIGAASVSSGTDATRTEFFNNVGASDVKLVVTSTNTGSGAGVLVVEYGSAVNI